jgi:hypothetical protein
MRTGARRAVLGAALQQGTGETEQGAAPTDQSTAVTEGEQQ